MLSFLLLSLLCAAMRCACSRVYVINLDARTDRMESLSAHLGRQHALTRVPARTPQDARLALEAGDIVLNATFRDPHSGRVQKWGELACALSHWFAWKQFAEQDSANADDWALFLEDDARLQHDATLDTVFARLELAPRATDFVYVGYKHMDGETRDVGNKLRSCAFNYWMLAYAMRRSAAAQLTRNDATGSLLRALIPVDEYMPIVVGALDTGDTCTESGACDTRDPRYPGMRLRCAQFESSLVEPAKVDTTVATQSGTESSQLVPSAPPANKAQLLVLTVATDEDHAGFRALRRTLTYYGIAFVNLGARREWLGGDMTAGTGGAFKLLLVVRFLRKEMSLHGALNKLVLFVDGYDVLLQQSESELLRKWHALSLRDTDVLFGAEINCWPSGAVCEQYADEENHGRYRFLNSGTYMGRASAILRLLLALDLTKPSADDQLLLSRRLAAQQPSDSAHIVLDHECRIFQTLASLPRDEWDVSYAGVPQLRNVRKRRAAAVLHGNGPSKRSLASVQNIVAGGYNSFYKQMHRQWHRPTPFADSDETLLLGLFFLSTPFQDDFFGAVDAMALPRHKVHLFLYQSTGSRFHVAAGWRNEFASVRSVAAPDDATALCKARALFLREARQLGVDWALSFDSTLGHLNDSTALLDELRGWDETLVAPHLNRAGRLFSNFWAAASSSGWYARGANGDKISSRAHRGLWRVAVLRGDALLFQLRTETDRARVERWQALFNDTVVSEADAGDHCECVRLAMLSALDRGLEAFVDNRRQYGLLLGEDASVKQGVLHPSLYEAHVTPWLWERHYLRHDWRTVRFDEVCQDVFGARYFTERFARELLTETEMAQLWSAGDERRYHDERIGGNELYPTQDVHMSQFGFEEAWQHVLAHYVKPAVDRCYEGVTFKAKINIAFVVRYTMDGQRKLDAHNDASKVTSSIVLNGAFEGGGTYFTRYNCSFTSKTPGFLVLHPGQVTHNHAGIPITEGKRYIAVSFNE